MADTPITEEVVLQDMDTLTKKSGKGSNAGQRLEIDTTRNAIDQKIDLTQAGISTPQTFSVLNASALPDGGTTLISVDRDGKSVATFKQTSDGKIIMEADKAFIDGIKTPEMTIGGKEDAATGLYVFEMERLNLTKSGSIDAGEVRAASTAMAIMFSALGAQMKDAENHMARQSNVVADKPEEGKPFDISVSTRFLEMALKEDEERCEISQAEPLFSSILASTIQLQRHLAGDEKKSEPIEYTLAGIKMSSVPFQIQGKDADGKDTTTTQYLNLFEINGKRYAYIQTTNRSGRTTAPQMYEINDLALQQSRDYQALHLGLKASGGNVRDVFIPISFDENKNGIKFLTDQASREFANADRIAREKKARRRNYAIDDKNVSVYPITSEATTRVESFDRVRDLSRSAVEEAARSETRDDPSRDGGDSARVTPPPPAGDPAPRSDGDPTAPRDPAPRSDGDHAAPPAAEEPAVPPRKTKKEKPMKPVKGPIDEFGNNGLTKPLLMTGLLSIFISAALPFAAIGLIIPLVAFGLAALNAIAPWNIIIDAINAHREHKKLKQELKMIKARIPKRAKDLNKIKFKKRTMDQQKTISNEYNRNLNNVQRKIDELEAKKDNMSKRRFARKMKKLTKERDEWKAQLDQSKARETLITLRENAEAFNADLKRQQTLDRRNIHYENGQMRRAGRSLESADKKVMNYLNVKDAERASLGITEDRLLTKEEVTRLKALRQTALDEAKLTGDKKAIRAAKRALKHADDNTLRERMETSEQRYTRFNNLADKVAEDQGARATRIEGAIQNTKNARIKAAKQKRTVNELTYGDNLTEYHLNERHVRLGESPEDTMNKEQNKAVEKSVNASAKRLAKTNKENNRRSNYSRDYTKNRGSGGMTR